MNSKNIQTSNAEKILSQNNDTPQEEDELQGYEELEEAQAISKIKDLAKKNKEFQMVVKKYKNYSPIELLKEMRAILATKKLLREYAELKPLAIKYKHYLPTQLYKELLAKKKINDITNGDEIRRNLLQETLEIYRPTEVLASMLDTDRSKPEYYLRLNHYSASEKKEFKTWYGKIKPFLDQNDEHGALEVLVDREKECLPKFDMYTLVKHYFKK